jgi:hypothetical protein
MVAVLHPSHGTPPCPKWRIAVRHEHGERRSRGCGNYQSGNSVAQTGKLAVSGTYAQNTGGALDVTHRGIGGLHAVRPTQRPAPLTVRSPFRHRIIDDRRSLALPPSSRISTCPRIARSGRRSPDQLDRGGCPTPAEPVACHEEMRSSGWNQQMPLMRRLEIRAPPSLASRKNRVLWAFFAVLMQPVNRQQLSVAFIWLPSLVASPIG